MDYKTSDDDGCDDEIEELSWQLYAERTLDAHFSGEHDNEPEEGCPECECPEED